MVFDSKSLFLPSKKLCQPCFEAVPYLCDVVFACDASSEGCCYQYRLLVSISGGFVQCQLWVLCRPLCSGDCVNDVKGNQILRVYWYVKLILPTLIKS